MLSHRCQYLSLAPMTINVSVCLSVCLTVWKSLIRVRMTPSGYFTHSTSPIMTPTRSRLLPFYFHPGFGNLERYWAVVRVYYVFSE